MLKFHDELKPSLFDYVLRVSINEKANLTDDDDEPPYITEVLFPTSEQDLKLPKTFQGIGLFFFSDVSDKYLTKGHPKFVSQWPENTAFSFCLTDEKKNIYFVFAYSRSNTVHCVISDYYHPAFLSDFIYRISTHKNPSKFANQIDKIFFNSANKPEDEQFFQDGDIIFVHDQYDWLFKIFNSENSNSESTSVTSLPLQGPKSVSSSFINRNQSKVQLLSSKRTSNLSIAKMALSSKSRELKKALSGLTKFDHMSPENELSQLYKFIFSNLQVEYILLLINAILLDFKIVIISHDVSKLGKAAFAIIGLLYPLKWPGSFIPICPEPMSTFLEAPFPYIIGIHSSLSMKLLEGDGMLYCVYNVDGHYVANIGMEDFPPNICNYIDISAEKIKSLIHSFSPLFPFAHLQREVRNFIKGTLANSYGLDPNDFGYKELMADFIVWRDESSSEYAAYFSQSQTVDHFMHSLENSEYEKDDRVFKAFFPNETFMGTVHIPRQLVEESLEKEKEDGIKINFEDLQMKSKLYSKTSIIMVNNGRNITFDSNDHISYKDSDTPNKSNADESSDRNSSEKDLKNKAENSFVSDSESGTINKSKHRHKHKHKSKQKIQRASMPIPPRSDLNDSEEEKEIAHTHHPMNESNSDDSDLSGDDNIDIEKIIGANTQKSKKNDKKYRYSAQIGAVSTFSASTSDTDQSTSFSDSGDSNARSSKIKRRVPPDLPSIPNKKSRASSSYTKSSSRKEKSVEKSEKKKKSKKVKKKSKSRSKTQPEKQTTKLEIENNSNIKKESVKEERNEKKTVLFIESDSDVEASSSSSNDTYINSNSNMISDDDWGTSSSSGELTKKANIISPQQRFTDEDDLINSSSDDDNNKQPNQKQQPKNNDTEKIKKKKKRHYKFNSDDTESQSSSDDDDDEDNENLSDAINKKQDESVLKMVKKSNFSNDEDDQTNNKNKEKTKNDSSSEDEDHSFIDSPIPKKNQKSSQADDTVLSPSKSKTKTKTKTKRTFTSDSDIESDNSEDLNDPSLKKKYRKSSNVKQSSNSKKSKGDKKGRTKNISDSDTDNSNSFNSDESD